MCGIAGIISNRPINKRVVHGMIEQLIHRGPDGEGVWLSENSQVCFGHRRLFVIDPSPSGSQPMIDPSGQYIITFNGAIYNYLELRDQLQSTGVRFRSNCDTEVLLESYKAWGKACLERLNGMFSFAIYDMHRNQIFCARDRFGEKPFLFWRGADYFAFASEYKALFVLNDLDVAIDEHRMLRFLDQPRQGLDDNRETLFRGVEQLLPGESMSIDAASLEAEIQRYWELDPVPELEKIDKATAVEQFYFLLEDSVRIRMRSDVPVGSALSGGLDSSSIVGLNRKLLGAGYKYNTFTGSFPGYLEDESSFAEIVRQRFDLVGHITCPNENNFIDDLENFIWFNELPVGSASQYCQWSVFRLAKEKGITVLLDGQGADEVLGGYEQYFAQYLSAISAFESRKVLSKEREDILARYPFALKRGALKGALPYKYSWFLAHLLGKGSDFLFGVSPEIAIAVKKANVRELDKRFNALSRSLKDDALYAHLPTLLRYGDRNSMAHSLEVRLPFCDHRIAEFTLSLNPKLLMGNIETKHLLRQSMSGVLPDQIKTRWNKQGFLPPQGEWFRGRLMNLISDVIGQRQFSERGYWETNWWEKTVKRFKAGESHLASPLWKLFISEMWRIYFVDRLKLERKLTI